MSTRVLGAVMFWVAASTTALVVLMSTQAGAHEVAEGERAGRAQMQASERMQGERAQPAQQSPIWGESQVSRVREVDDVPPAPNGCARVTKAEFTTYQAARDASLNADYDRAIQLAESLFAKHPKCERVLLVLAMTYEKRGDRQTAVTFYNRIIQGQCLHRNADLISTRIERLGGVSVCRPNARPKRRPGRVVRQR